MNNVTALTYLFTDYMAGMAVNLAYALGIHKEETLSMFNQSEQAARYAISQYFSWTIPTVILKLTTYQDAICGNLCTLWTVFWPPALVVPIQSTVRLPLSYVLRPPDTSPTESSLQKTMIYHFLSRPQES